MYRVGLAALMLLVLIACDYRTDRDMPAPPTPIPTTLPTPTLGRQAQRLNGLWQSTRGAYLSIDLSAGTITHTRIDYDATYSYEVLKETNDAIVLFETDSKTIIIVQFINDDEVTWRRVNLSMDREEVVHELKREK